jgi:hypothetical protein
LAQAERILREKAAPYARRLAEEEIRAWRDAQEACFLFDRIRHNANVRLDAIRAGSPEWFVGERRLAEMALRDADFADAKYVVISFARLRDRIRYLRGGSERETVVREALERGGVCTERRGFQEILR